MLVRTLVIVSVFGLLLRLHRPHLLRLLVRQIGVQVLQLLLVDLVVHERLLRGVIVVDRGGPYRELYLVHRVNEKWLEVRRTGRLVKHALAVVASGDDLVVQAVYFDLRDDVVVLVD